MRPYRIVAAGVVALAWLPAALGADADPLAAGAPLGTDAMAAVSGAGSEADAPPAAGAAGAPNPTGVALPLALPATGVGPSFVVIGDGNVVASAVVVQSYSEPTAPAP